jgi:hypothetical protein
MRTAGQRRTVLMSHHQPFTRNTPIAGEAVNPRLMHQCAAWLPQIALWLWGHEHNQVIYAPFKGVAKGRCLGASAIPTSFPPDLYEVAEALRGLPADQIPGILHARLAVDAKTGLYNLGFAVLSLNNKEGACEYFQYDVSAQTVTSLLKEPL